MDTSAQSPRITLVFHRKHDFGYCSLYDIEVPEPPKKVCNVNQSHVVQKMDTTEVP